MSCTATRPEPTEEHKPIESEFFEIDEKDEYASIGDVVIEHNDNDYDYPVTISAETEDGRDIGLVLSRAGLKRLVMEAWYAGVI